MITSKDLYENMYLTYVINDLCKFTGSLFGVCYSQICSFHRLFQSELLGQFRLIGDLASDVSGERMSNPKRLHWNIVFTKTYESRLAITNDRKQTWRRLNKAQSELLGQFHLTGNRAK